MDACCLFMNTHFYSPKPNSGRWSKIVLLQKDLFLKNYFYIASQGTGARPPLILWHGSHGPRGPHATYAYVNNGGRQVTEKPFTSKWKKEMRDG